MAGITGAVKRLLPLRLQARPSVSVAVLFRRCFGWAAANVGPEIQLCAAALPGGLSKDRLDRVFLGGREQVRIASPHFVRSVSYERVDDSLVDSLAGTVADERMS